MSGGTEHLIREVIDLTPILRRHILRPMEACAEERVSQNQQGILSLLLEGPRSMAQIGRAILVCRQQMTGLIEELIQKGYVTRARGIADRRTVMIAITDQGLEYMNAREAEMMRALYPIFDGYTEEQKSRLIQTAQTMREIMHG